MTSINMLLPSQWSTVTTRARPRPASASWLGRAWAALRERLGSGGSPDRVLELNDRLLRDIGVKRVNLEYEALFWPIWRPGSTRRR